MREAEHRRAWNDDLRVIPWKEWYLSKGFKKDTARRLRLSGDGPRIVYLTERKFGVTVRDDREWVENRIRGAAVSRAPHKRERASRGARFCLEIDQGQERLLSGTRFWVAFSHLAFGDCLERPDAGGAKPAPGE
jgi:hypothetical protein